MEYKIHCHATHPALHQALKSHVEDHLPQIDRVTSKFPVRMLLASGDRQRGTQVFRVKLVLYLENRSLSATAESPFLESAVSLVFRKLFRQVRILKEKLRKSRTYERVRVKKESLPNPAEIDELSDELQRKVTARDFLGFRQCLVGLIPRLEKFVRRELRFHVEGRVLPGRAEMARDIVEEALLHTFEKIQDMPEGLDPEKWIFRHALELVSQYIRNAREEILEIEWSGNAPAEWKSEKNGVDEEEKEQEDLLSELEDFPVEVVELDGITAADLPGGDEESSQALERKQALSWAMNHLPQDERKAITLCFLEGFRPVEAALAMNSSEERIRHLVDEGTQRLRGVLRQAILG